MYDWPEGMGAGKSGLEGVCWVMNGMGYTGIHDGERFFLVIPLYLNLLRLRITFSYIDI